MSVARRSHRGAARHRAGCAVVPEFVDDSLRVVRLLQIKLGGVPGRSLYPENGQ